MTVWHWLVEDFKDKGLEDFIFYPHAIPDELLEQQVEDMKERGMRVYDLNDIANPLFIDTPGMCLQKEHCFDIEVDGLGLWIPARSLPELLAVWEDTEMNTTLTRPFHVLGGWRRVLVVSPDQHSELVCKMRDLLLEAQAVNDIQNARFNEAISTLPDAVITPRPVGDTPKA